MISIKKNGCIMVSHVVSHRVHLLWTSVILDDIKWTSTSAIGFNNAILQTCNRLKYKVGPPFWAVTRLFILWPRGESNPNRWNRNPIFYPLNYGDIYAVRRKISLYLFSDAKIRKFAITTRTCWRIFSLSANFRIFHDGFISWSIPVHDGFEPP